ncbi:outer membrane adhesin like protein [Reticulomyxa filosa]|uniref:Outer membrane adhesin like protein n=1 Tax=Reticulomyxa filosa TaxID=46433 RepID=X6MS51_RETFI|nr:outer membrane adhesin like protein [Reticulomyxa filosa]|eukprot:ETO15890.1 outer membrane adhesin like proteiin [Reticulomyxa filosa]
MKSCWQMGWAYWKVVTLFLCVLKNMRVCQSTVVTHAIPNQVIEVNRQYNYSLDGVFEGNFTRVEATESGKSGLPSWLALEYAVIDSDARYFAHSVTVVSNRAYVAADGGVEIFDVTNKSAPVLLSIYPLQNGAARNVVIWNAEMAFVASGTAGVQLLNVSNGSDPTWISAIDAGPGGYTYDLAMWSQTLFVANGAGGLRIVDVANVSHPRVLCTFNASFVGAQSLYVDHDIVYVANAYGGLQLINVSNKTEPVLLSTVSSGSGNAQAVRVQGTTAFVAEYVGIRIIDVSNKTHPKVLAVLDNDEVAKALNLDISGNLVFMANGYEGIEVINVTNQSRPVTLTSYLEDYGIACGVTIVNDSTLFVADGQTISITITAWNATTRLNATTFRLKTIQSPRPLENNLPDQSICPGMSSSVWLESRSLFAYSGNAVLTLSLTMQDGSPLPSWLTLLPAFTLVNTQKCGSTFATATSGNVLLVANDKHGLKLFDISDTTNMQLLSTYPSGVGGSVRGLAIVDDDDNDDNDSGNGEHIAYIANAANGLIILDISIPTNPRLLCNYIIGNINGVTVVNNIAYLAAGVDGLLIVDVQNASHPTLLSVYKESASSFTKNVVVRDSIAFVANMDAGLHIVNVSNASAPQLISIIPSTPGKACDVALKEDGDIILVANLINLFIIDIRDLSNPHLLWTYPAGSGYNIPGVTVVGNTTLISNWEAGVKFFDISNASNPIFLGELPSSNGVDACTYSTTVSSNTIFVSDASAGFRTIDASQWELTAQPLWSDVGNYKLHVVAMDEFGATGYTNLVIRVEGPPKIMQSIPKQIAMTGQSFYYFVPEGVIVDHNHDQINFTARLSDGHPLPSWLFFNSISATFAGVPQESHVGTLTITLFASDNIAGTVNTSFELHVNYVPTVVSPIPKPPSIRVGKNFSFYVSETTFHDVNDVLTYNATYMDGTRLPNWLHFNSDSLHFFGVPTTADLGTITLAVTATDSYNATTFAAFDLAVIANSPPLLERLIPNQKATVTEDFAFAVPLDTFVDPNGDELTWIAETSHAKWLTFDPEKKSFFGRPEREDTNVLAPRTVTVQLSAGDGQSFTTTSFNIDVYGDSWPVFVATQVITIGPILTYLFYRYRRYTHRKNYVLACHLRTVLNLIYKDFACNDGEPYAMEQTIEQNNEETSFYNNLNDIEQNYLQFVLVKLWKNWEYAKTRAVCTRCLTDLKEFRKQIPRIASIALDKLKIYIHEFQNFGLVFMTHRIFFFSNFFLQTLKQKDWQYLINVKKRFNFAVLSYYGYSANQHCNIIKKKIVISDIIPLLLKNDKFSSTVSRRRVNHKINNKIKSFQIFLNKKVSKRSLKQERICTKRRGPLEKRATIAQKSMELQENLCQFNNFLKDKSDKRAQYLKKGEDEKAVKLIKQKEVQAKNEELKISIVNATTLEEEFKTLQKYEQYLETVKRRAFHECPDVESILKKYNLLNETRRTLERKEENSAEELEQLRMKLSDYSNDQNNICLDLNNENQRLQKKYEKIKNENQELELTISKIIQQNVNQNRELTELVISVRNLYDKCTFHLRNIHHFQNFDDENATKVNNETNAESNTRNKNANKNETSAKKGNSQSKPENKEHIAIIEELLAFEIPQKLDIIRHYIIDYKDIVNAQCTLQLKKNFVFDCCFLYMIFFQSLNCTRNFLIMLLSLRHFIFRTKRKLSTTLLHMLASFLLFTQAVEGRNLFAYLYLFVIMTDKKNKKMEPCPFTSSFEL